jgi:predicted small metal-binding protein
MKCYDCDQTFSANSADEILKAMYPHYRAEHKEIISSVDEDAKKIWMERFYADFEKA